MHWFLKSFMLGIGAFAVVFGIGGVMFSQGTASSWMAYIGSILLLSSPAVGLLVMLGFGFSGWRKGRRAQRRLAASRARPTAVASASRATAAGTGARRPPGQADRGAAPGPRPRR